MTNIISGINFNIRFSKNELTSPNFTYVLPEGYTINIMHITNVINVDIVNGAVIRNNIRLVFPVVNSKSPSTFTIHINDITQDAELRFTIEKFGQIPDPHYFDKAFDPIIITGDDGNEYNVIPSDQFK